MKALVATKQQLPQSFTYIVRPINITARLKMVPKPERDQPEFSRPKIDISVDIEEIGLNIGKFQYQDVLEFLENMDRMTVAGRYRIHRPNLMEYRGHAKEWWNFAFQCILKEEIQRRHQNWSWEHMKFHLEFVRSYKRAWLEKLTNKSIKPHDLKIIEVRPVKKLH